MNRKAIAVIAHYNPVEDCGAVKEYPDFFTITPMDEFKDGRYPNTAVSEVEEDETPQESMARTLNQFLYPQKVKVHGNNEALEFKLGNDTYHVIPVIADEEELKYRKDMVKDSDAVSPEQYSQTVANDAEARFAMKPVYDALLSALFQDPEFWKGNNTKNDIQNIHEELKKFKPGPGGELL